MDCTLRYIIGTRKTGKSTLLSQHYYISKENYVMAKTRHLALSLAAKIDARFGEYVVDRKRHVLTPESLDSMRGLYKVNILADDLQVWSHRDQLKLLNFVNMGAGDVTATINPEVIDPEHIPPYLTFWNKAKVHVLEVDREDATRKDMQRLLPEKIFLSEWLGYFLIDPTPEDKPKPKIIEITRDQLL